MSKFKILILFLSISTALFAQDFLRDLPKDNLIKLLTPEKFPTMDAVIVLKEQSYVTEPTTIDYAGSEITGPNTAFTKIIIAKLLTEKAVKRYGTIEFSYSEAFGKEFPNGYFARARVLKPNGDVIVMPEENVKNIITLSTSDDIPRERKVIFKIPDLAPGDVVQYEYQYSDIFEKSRSGFFFYNDRDPILYSNLYVTLPSSDEFDVFSFPESVIGKPKVQQISEGYGAGKTYFWSVRNLNPIPDEPYSSPFEENSMLTAFVIRQSGRTFMGDWNTISKNYCENFLQKGSISNSEIEKLGFSPDRDTSNVNFQTTDSLYYSLRKHFVLAESNSLYPYTDDIDKVFDSKKGDASDMAYIFYKVLKSWKNDVHSVWIRDKRQGRYERTVPSMLWFDRIGVLVNINGTEKLYDFDRSIPDHYVTPWYLDNIEAMVLDGENSYQRKFVFPDVRSENLTEENHNLYFDQNFAIIDSMQIDSHGVFAEDLRSDYYDSETPDIKKSLEDELQKNCLSSIDAININKFLEDEDFKYSAVGKSINGVDKLDSLLALKLADKTLTEFKDKMYSIVRRNDIHFGESFKFNIHWKINFPKGYTIKEIPSVEYLSGASSSSAVLNFSLKKASLDVSAKISFPDEFIKLSDYKLFIKFLDSISGSISKNIVLKKV